MLTGCTSAPEPAVADDPTPSARIASVLPSLLPSERRVAELIMAEPAAAVEATAQELADRAAVARSTVVRTCQSLGYTGYPQLRVALARELAARPAAEPEYAASALGGLQRSADGIATGLDGLTSMLDDATVDRAVALLSDARRLVVVGNGLSGPLATEFALRLTAVGRPAEFVADPISQRVAISALGADDACVVVSGSGASEASIRAARTARGAGTPLVVLTSFSQSPLVALADAALVVPPTGGFRTELERTSRVAHALLVEALVDVVSARLGDASRAARERVLAILEETLSE
jgi:RpiR family transcriptional regulator, carbohydrate utilization regulator